MLSSIFYSVLALAAATAGAQSTKTATVLIPDWCLTQAQPTVTAMGQGDLTTYSYSCSINSAAVSSASERAFRDSESARSKASLGRSRVNDAKPTDSHNNKSNNDNNNQRRSLPSFHAFGKRDGDCYGWNAFEACIPWEITQGASTWAVRYTAGGIGALSQECTFGSGGVASGAATCTASGRLDPGIWGVGNGPRTHTFAKNDVDRFWIRNTVAVTAGGRAATTGAASSSRAVAPSATAGAENMAMGAEIPITGLVAMALWGWWYFCCCFCSVIWNTSLNDRIISALAVSSFRCYHCHPFF